MNKITEIFTYPFSQFVVVVRRPNGDHPYYPRLALVKKLLDQCTVAQDGRYIPATRSAAAPWRME